MENKDTTVTEATTQEVESQDKNVIEESKAEVIEEKKENTESKPQDAGKDQRRDSIEKVGMRWLTTEQMVKEAKENFKLVLDEQERNHENEQIVKDVL